MIGTVTTTALVVYTIATIFYTIFARRQWLAITAQLEAMKEQANVMRESLIETKKIAQQNERAVKAAEESALTAKESVALEQRAYVEVKEMKILNLAPKTKPKIRITWVNGGRTPAWHLRCFPNMVLAAEPPTDLEHLNVENFDAINSSFLPPGNERTFDYELTNEPTNDDFAKLSNNQTNLYLFVTARYTDARGVPQQTNVFAIYDYRKEMFLYKDNSETGALNG